MRLRAQYTDKNGKLAEILYEDVDSFDHLLSQKTTQCYGFCFCGDKFLIVYNRKKDSWTPAGGSIEKGETFEGCLKREIAEESNMKVVSFKPVGYQEVLLDGEKFNQLRFVCIIEPYGNFISDPAGSITEIKLIDPKDYKKYFDWGEIGAHIMMRSLELKDELLK